MSYGWGDFRGDTWGLLEAGYDAHLYTSNFGQARVVLVLPGVEQDLLAPYRTIRQGRVRPVPAIECLTRDRRGRLVVDLAVEEAEDPPPPDPLGGSAGRPVLDALLPVRERLAEGDLRALYLTWLANLGTERVDPGELEPPVPPGLADLPADLSALAEVLVLEADLLAAAAQASPDLPDMTSLAEGLQQGPGPTGQRCPDCDSPGPGGLVDLLAGVDEQTRDGWSAGLLAGGFPAAVARGQLRTALRAAHPGCPTCRWLPPAPAPGTRTATDLLQAAQALRQGRRGVSTGR